MLTLPSSVRVYIALDPINLHLSFDRLAGLVRRLGLDPTTGHLFVFVNRQKTHMKILFFDRSGFCMLYKRLERGTFEVPSIGPDGAVKRELTPSELGLILEGVALDARPRRARLGRSVP
jgi:transposase